MDAIELFKPCGTSAGVWYCAKCRIVSRRHEQAEKCCRPSICGCGEVCDPHWTACAKCRAFNHEQRLVAAWMAAPKLDGWEWNGPVVTDDQEGHADGYWHDVDELLCWLEDEGKTIHDVRAYATKQVRMHAPADRVIEWMLQDQHEDAVDELASEAYAELQAALDAWCEKHGTVSYVQGREALVFEVL